MTIQRSLLLTLAGLLATTSSDSFAQCRSIRYGVPSYGYHRVPVTPYIARRPIVVPPTTHWAYQPLPQVTFGGCSHVDHLSHRLEIVMNELCLDLYYNYAHNPGFAVTYAEAYELYQLARGIHAANHNLDRAAMQSQLAGAGHLFLHVRDDLRSWTRHPRRQIGTLGIMTKVEMADDILQRLMQDVGVRVDPILETPPLPGQLPGGVPLGAAPGSPGTLGAPLQGPLGNGSLGNLPQGTGTFGNAPLPPVDSLPRTSTPQGRGDSLPPSNSLLPPADSLQPPSIPFR